MKARPAMSTPLFPAAALGRRAAPLVAALALALAACQTTPKANPDLAAARAAMEQARAQPLAARVAAVDLDRAQQALAKAEFAWAKDGDADETRHLAYVARRRADVVVALAAQAEAEERLGQASGERERLRLEARTREAEAAGAAARSAQAQQQQSQQQAQSAQQQAQSAQQQAQSAQQQAEAARRATAAETERARALERDLQSLQAKATQRGLVVTMGDVLFATGRATLQPGAQRGVQRLAQVLQQYPERKVLVEGFTDSTGAEDTNLELSQRRADAFRQALTNAGVSAERVEVRAHGEAFPVADNGTAAGRQQNRRVEIVFSDAQGRFQPR